MAQVEKAASSGVRYPLRAIVIMTAAWLFFALQLVILCLMLMPMIPLIPLFIVFVLGNACLLGTVYDYVRTLAKPR
ncbi:MAG TPA: hypothetical protein VKY73_08595 [Polyangiaceae bacterium]|nr:hypothetical protein [Polyangiaceae bacterium]